MLFNVYKNGNLTMVLRGSEDQCKKSINDDSTYEVVTVIDNSVPYYDLSKYYKNLLLAKINRIKVTTSSNKTFDGDEKSQDRMARAINIASISGQTETQWKLADNTIVTVTLDELKEALSLAGKRMSEMWLNQ